ncbi:helix-turn-helix domain-containing protein [Streptomyces niger]|uniref:helix-turn-helix domain-containing protein n=1 Tax=Streptomyces niger TaxID=66373 RepID=UPI00069A2FF3|nr:XRE family transcriptional regulator [Streptomyces niger]
MREDQGAPQVGRAVRRRRRALDLTLAELAGRTDLSKPFLSQVENDRARPSMRSLQRIADALETTAVQLLGAAEDRRAVDVVRADPAAALADGAAGAVRPLVRGQQQLHALEFTGTHEWGREFRHPNDELLYVIEGAVEAEAEGQRYELGRGDTLYCTGGVTHRWRAQEPGARVLLVGVADDVGL